MQFCKLSAVVFPMVLAQLSACGITHGGNVADKPNHSHVSPALTENVLNNATYRIDELGIFRLANGEYLHTYGEGMTQRHKVTLEKAAFGDLDGDGLSDAAVILAWQSGGSGTLKYLVAMRNTGNEPRQQDSVLLGDRVRIRALSIAAGVVNVETVTFGPRDPMCCPTRQAKQAYSLRGGKWAQSADGVAASASNTNITSIVWKWTRFEDTSKVRNFAIDDPNQYTLTLLPNGSYRVKADCNRMLGQYSLQGRLIRIAQGAATLAECGAGSRYAEYLRHLSAAVSFDLPGSKRVLKLMTDGGHLVFEHGGEVSESHEYIRPKSIISDAPNPLK